MNSTVIILKFISHIQYNNTPNNLLLKVESLKKRVTPELAFVTPLPLIGNFKTGKTKLVISSIKIAFVNLASISSKKIL